MSSVGDTSLTVGVIRGRHEALAEVYERHGAHVHEVALRMCGEADADDVVQGVFLSFWQEPDSFDPGRRSLRSHLLLLTRRQSVEALRARTAPSDAPGDGASTDASELLSRLAVPERDAISSALQRGSTYRDVALALGQPAATVASDVRAGLARLHAHLSDRSD